MDEYFKDNLASWDERAPAHAASPDYAVQQFVDDPAFLSHVVQFDLPLLGDIAGLRGVHLQCHIGTDTVSLARLGARMTGLDFSPASIEQARNIAQRIDADVNFVVSDVHDAVEALGGEQFDFVFTGIGALCWLPDVEKWAQVVGALLAPGGRLFLREGHPVLWSIDEERADGALLVDFPYFQTAQPLTYAEGGTYVATDVEFVHNRSHTWNHGLGEVITALIGQGLVIDSLVEHTSVPWEALPGRVAKGADGEWQLIERHERLPLTYTLKAHRPLV
ncbi:MAG: class I SAM-dependent methyltransferase [Actinobacteria bacterium]|nr:class I SAM-dependent methyltransferase [Actinomycetota bacterium]